MAIAPAAQMSTALVYASLELSLAFRLGESSNISGAMYTRVPAKVIKAAWSSIVRLLRPKSATLIHQSGRFR